MLKKIVAQMIVLTMFIGFIPFGNFASASGNKQPSTKNVLEKIEVLEARTETSKTYNNHDGTFSTEIYEAPIHFKGNNGSWKEIDNELQKQKVNGKGQFKNKDNNFVVTFDEKLEDDTNHVQVTENQYTLDMGLKEIEQNGEVILANEVIGVATENQIQYTDVFENISTTYSVGENFVKEDIIIDKKPENGLPQSFSYQLSLENMSYEQINNQIYLKDAATGEMIYVIEAPFMYDAFKPSGFQSIDGIEAIPEEAKSYDITLQTRKENNSLWIDLIPDSAWLQGEERQFPIVIDPTIIRIQGNSKMVDTTIRKNFPTQTGGNDTELGTGTATDGNIVRSLMKFDVSPIPKYSVILSADLNLYLSSSNSPNPIDLSLHSMKRSWDENTATWNNYATAGKWTAVGGDYNTAALSTVNGISSVPSKVEDGLKRWALPTDLVRDWVVNSNTNLGVLLKSTTEGTLIYKKFISSESTTNPLAYKPKLVVTFKTPNRLGLEGYWDYASHNLSNGSNYVNLGTNNNIIQYTDFSLFNYADFGLDFTRTYNSKDFEKSDFGYGWSFTGSQKLYLGTNGSDIDYKDADGTVHVFKWDGNNYVAPAGNYDRLEKVDATSYKLTTQTGYTSTFTVRENSTDTDVKVAYITTQSDRNSNTITYSYNTVNQLTFITTNLGTQLTFDYDADGLISKINLNNQEITYAYTDGNLIRVVVKKDATTTTATSFYYTMNGQLTKIIDSNQKTMLYEYNNEWDLISVTEPSLEGQVTSITNYALNRTTIPQVMTVTSPEGSITQYELNDNYVAEKIIDASGETTTYKLDKNTYNVLTETVGYADGSSYKKDYNYDSKGNVLSTTDSKGVSESFMYDQFSNVLKHTDAKNQITTNTYENGNLKTTTSPKGEKTSFAYDTRGDLKSITYPSGKINSFDNDYSKDQKRTVHTDVELGITTETITDFNGNMTSYKDGKNQLTTYDYNLKNELIKVTDANGITNYKYDGNGNLVTVTNAAGKQINLGYNEQNAVKEEKNAEGKITKYHYNADGELTEVVKADRAVIGYTNDEETQTSVVKINNVNQFTTKKDSLITTVTNHTLNNQMVTYTESENGLLQRIDFSAPKNNAITYGYKNEESLETIQFGTNTINYTPDENGQTKSL
ncbi:MAG: DNRLRE domain-containing protein, partial [Psychrobacillus sp.]